ncbi:MAG TPA: DUF971 domain-containing protein [Ilumatobacteraceae bacterium]
MGGPAVVDVEVDRAREVRVTYDDGVVAAFSVVALREACPCAGCRGRRERGLTARVDPGRDVTIIDASLHGNWGIAIRWSDGHDTGIHSWSNLRAWWDAGSDSLP